MIRTLAILMVFACTAGCSKTDRANADDGGAVRQSKAASALNTAGMSSAKDGKVPYERGQILEIIADRTYCRMIRPDDGIPWELVKGRLVKFMAVEGRQLRIEHSPGMECLVAPDAVKTK